MHDADLKGVNVEEMLMHSPFAHILHTNDRPSDIESNEIRLHLSEPKAELARLEEEIVRKIAVLNRLWLQRDRVKSYVDSHQALISPLRRFPPELLQQIFVECLPETRNCVMHSKEAPLLLTAVCAHWRHVALSTPELWSSLHIAVPLPASLYAAYMDDSLSDDPIADNSLAASRIATAGEWLSRSGVRPLDISVHDLSSDSGVVDFLLPLCSRWRNISFSMPMSSLKPLKDLTGDDLPTIHSITIRQKWESSSQISGTAYWHRTLPFLFRIPQLHTFIIESGSDLFPAETLPLERLRVLHLHYLDFSPGMELQSLEFLRRCSDLQTFSLRGIVKPTNPEIMTTKQRPILLPKLRTLAIHIADSAHVYSNAGDLLDCLILPRLCELTINASIEPLFDRDPNLNSNPPLHTSLLSLLCRSSCALEKFSLHDSCMLVTGLIDFLYHVPSLVQLDLQDWVNNTQRASSIDDDFLRLLTRTADEPSKCLCPNLRTVSLKLTNTNNLTDSVLFDLLRSRSRGAGNLTTFNIMFSSRRHVPPELEALRSELEGMKISYKMDPDDEEGGRGPWEGLESSAEN